MGLVVIWTPVCVSLVKVEGFFYIGGSKNVNKLALTANAFVRQAVHVWRYIYIYILYRVFATCVRCSERIYSRLKDPAGGNEGCTHAVHDT